MDNFIIIFILILSLAIIILHLLVKKDDLSRINVNNWIVEDLSRLKENVKTFDSSLDKTVLKNFLYTFKNYNDYITYKSLNSFIFYKIGYFGKSLKDIPNTIPNYKQYTDMNATRYKFSEADLKILNDGAKELEPTLPGVTPFLLKSFQDSFQNVDEMNKFLINGTDTSTPTNILMKISIFGYNNFDMIKIKNASKFTFLQCQNMQYVKIQQDLLNNVKDIIELVSFISNQSTVDNENKCNAKVI